VDLKKNDEEGFVAHMDEFERINMFLRKIGFSEHKEPININGKDIFSCDMLGYSGLHYLRRIAAYIAQGKTMPEPGDINSAKDPELDHYQEAVMVSGKSIFKFIFGKTKGQDLAFQHLTQHSDCEGYYLPIDFEEVLYTPDKYQITGMAVGSSYQLYEECKELAGHLELPMDMDHESERVFDATVNQGNGSCKWEKYGVESYTCLALLRACEASIKFGAAIVFC
jgi:hypothetical protein